MPRALSHNLIDRLITYDSLDRILDELETPDREFLQYRYSIIPYDCGRIRPYRILAQIYGISHTSARKKHLKIIDKIKEILQPKR